MQKDIVDLKITNSYYFHIIHMHNCFGKNRYQELKLKLQNHCALSLIIFFLSVFLWGSAGSSLLHSGASGSGFSCCGARAVGHSGFKSCGTWPLGSRAQAQSLWLMGLVVCGTWDLPRSGIKPVSPAVAGRFFTTEPVGKPLVSPLNPSPQS